MFHNFTTFARKQLMTPSRRLMAGMGALSIPTIYSQLNPSTVSKYTPSFSYIKNTFVAQAKVLPPHPEFPPPTTYREAIDYNDYPPGFTEPVPEYTEAQKKGVGVIKVVAENFEDLAINDTGYDVFLKIGKDNCHSCASFSRVLDALSFAFRDVPSIRFMEMKGTRNYIPGVLTAEEEMLYPSFKFFPAGQQTVDQMKRAKQFVKDVRAYNEEVLKIHDPNAKIDDNFELELEKRTFPGVGQAMDMVMAEQDIYVWEQFIDFIAANSTHKFDVDQVKQQIKIVEPALKKEISNAIRESMPAYELIGSLAPCGQEWDRFQDAMTRRGVGASLVSEFHSAMSSLQKCVATNYGQEEAFWRSNMDHASHMLVVLNLVKQAKVEGLPDDRIGDFFIQMNHMLSKRKDAADRRKQEAEKELTTPAIPVDK